MFTSNLQKNFWYFSILLFLKWKKLNVEIMFTECLVRTKLWWIITSSTCVSKTTVLPGIIGWSEWLWCCWKISSSEVSECCHWASASRWTRRAGRYCGSSRRGTTTRLQKNLSNWRATFDRKTRSRTRPERPPRQPETLLTNPRAWKELEEDEQTFCPEFSAVSEFSI